MRETRRPAKDIYLHTKNHSKLIQANTLIERARVLEEQVKQEQDVARKKLKPEYVYKASVNIAKEDHWNNLPDGTEVLTIQALLSNKDIFDDHMHVYGSMFMYPEETRSSLKYYRKHGLLFHTGSGWRLLKDEQPCSDEDWAELKRGYVSEKFRL